MISESHGPDFMKPYFYPCLPLLKDLLPAHNVCQGIKCFCNSKELSVLERKGHSVIFAHCPACDSEFKIYANQDHPAGYILDDPAQPLYPITCQCGGHIFEVAVGYEYPGDEIDSTDITWFTMAGKCTICGAAQELFSDESG